MIDKLETIWALMWAMGYCYIVHPIGAWYKRHQRDADYFTHMGWICGLLLSIMMIFWGLAQ